MENAFHGKCIPIHSYWRIFITINWTLEIMEWEVACLLDNIIDNVCFCCVPGCSNNSVKKPCSNDSVKKPGLTFHRLLLKNKKLLKVWIHKIGQKNLPVNDNTWVCSEHFVNSAGRWVRKDVFPSLNLPVLPTSMTMPVKRKSPRKRSEDVCCRSICQWQRGGRL